MFLLIIANNLFRTLMPFYDADTDMLLLAGKVNLNNNEKMALCNNDLVAF